MPDSDVQITAGSGTKIDTRTVGAGVDEHRQVVVIGDPTSASAVAPVDAVFGLDVDVSRVVPGTGATNLGKAEDAAHADGDVGVMMLGVRNHFSGSTTDGDYSALSVGPFGDLNTLRRADLQRISVAAGNLSTSSGGGAPNTTYTSGDQAGTLFTLSGAARVSGGGGIITSVCLLDASAVIGSCDVVFFDSTVTLATDNSAFSISDPDALKTVGVAQLAGAISFSQNRWVQATGLYIPYVCSGGTSLFAAIITRSANAVFGATNAIQLIVYVERF